MIDNDTTEYEDLVSERIEKEGKQDGTVAILSTVTAVLLSMVLMMAALGGTDTVVSTAPSAASQDSAPKQERVYQPPEVQEEESFDFLIDQSAGFFFY